MPSGQALIVTVLSMTTIYISLLEVRAQQSSDFERCKQRCESEGKFYEQFGPTGTMVKNCLDKCIVRPQPLPKMINRSTNHTSANPTVTRPVPTTIMPRIATTAAPTTTTSTTTPSTTTTRTTSTTTPSTTTTRSTTTHPTTKPTTTIKTTTTTKSSNLPLTSGCGVQKEELFNQDRIVGGTSAADCEYPWMAFIMIPNSICAGAILDNLHILTAAHCIKQRSTNTVMDPSSVEVRVGSATLRKGKLYSVAMIIAHPHHDPINKINDAAVLVLREKMVFSECTSPICLPEQNSDPRDAEFCVAAGWGVTNINLPSVTPYLQAVRLSIVDQELCKSSYGEEKVNELTFCAGDFYNGARDSCQGDSGGPFMCRLKGQNRYVAHGIVSNGYSCAQPRFPGIYTRVANPNILQFILSALLLV